MKKSLCFLVLTLIFFRTNAQTASDKTLEQRIQLLEQQQQDFEKWYSDYYVQSKGRVSPFLGESISFGGFFESAITHLSGPDTPAQTSANSHALGINIAAAFTEDVKFVSQFISAVGYPLQNIHNNPALAVKQRQYSGVTIATLVAQAYVEFAASEAFVFQSGIGYTPFGHAFQQREPVLFLRRNGPQMINSSDIAFPLWMGVHLSGKFQVSESHVGYNVYTFSPATNAKNLGVGSRLWWSNLNGITLGVSWQYAEPLPNSYYAYGADLDMKFGSAGITVEYARQVTSGSGRNESYYLEPYYTLGDGKFVLYATADYFDNRTYLASAVSDSIKRWDTGGGINWLPIPNARFRLGVLNHQYVGGTDVIAGQRRDFSSVDFSTGIAF